MSRQPYWIEDAQHDGRQRAAMTYRADCGASPSTWEHTCVQSAVRDGLRRQAAHHRRIAGAASVHQEQTEAASHEIPFRGWMSPDDRMILVLRTRGVGFREIAIAVNGRDKETIRNRYYRLLDAMREEAK